MLVTKYEEMMLLEEIQKSEMELAVRKAKREFFFYCNLKAPDFYKPERKYLVELCQDLQDFYDLS